MGGAEGEEERVIWEEGKERSCTEGGSGPGLLCGWERDGVARSLALSPVYLHCSCEKGVCSPGKLSPAPCCPRTGSERHDPGGVRVPGVQGATNRTQQVIAQVVPDCVWGVRGVSLGCSDSLTVIVLHPLHCCLSRRSYHDKKDHDGRS
ncbi:hypothetical protein E2C01_028049 [Portunus trituberculatus]|uniref:Uncharacterized protein n=1 Tax=Portunus trituberculatus TaxID=210409 RepID=A0A5B7EP11_PORTR|nr:hypothetical protein [Portunus trituberculatus]